MTNIDLQLYVLIPRFCWKILFCVILKTACYLTKKKKKEMHLEKVIYFVNKAFLQLDFDIGAKNSRAKAIFFLFSQRIIYSSPKVLLPLTKESQNSSLNLIHNSIISF